MQDADPQRSDAAGARDVEMQQLRDELAKWRARVHRLVSALRQRTEELEALRLPGTPSGTSASRQELADLRGEVRSWEQKLSETAESLKDHRRWLAEVRQERDQLQERNAQLMETTELANSQLGHLAEIVEELRERVRLSSERELELSRGLEGATAQESHLTCRLEALAGQADDIAAFAQTLCASAVTSVWDLQAANRRLEDLRRDKDAELQSLRQRAERAEEALDRAERAAQENSRHVMQLDDRLERQKTLLAELEEELAEVHAARFTDERQQEALAARNAEIDALKKRVRGLEQVLREQTTASSRERWQKDAAPVPDAERNDDLTRIRGVGPKLARQLNAIGIFRLQQIAELDPDGLADEAHRLHVHKGRILRDGWIEQAARLVSH